MTYFNIIAANLNEILLIRCYQKHKFTTIRVGYTYKFTNIIKKEHSCWIIGTSSIGYAPTAPTGTFSEAKLVLPEDESPAGQKRSLNEAMTSPQKSTVVGKIVKVSPLAYRREGSLAVRSLAIKDSTSLVKVALFERNAEANYLPNSCVEISGLYKKTYQNRTQLTATHATTCQFLPDHTIDVAVEQQDEQFFNTDPDFCVPYREAALQNIVVETINDVTMYDCCSNNACRKKKIINNVCPTCQGSSSQLTYRLKVSMTVDGESKEMTLFQSTGILIFGDIPITTENSLIDNLISHLPKSFKAKLSQNNLYDIQ